MAATAAYLPLRAQAQVGLAPLRPSGSAAAGARLPGRTARRRLAARGGPEAAGIRAEAVPGGGGVARRAAMVPPYNVLITGSTKGIGYALAKEFLKAGDNVVICSRSAERVESAVTDLKKEFGEQHVWGIVCDVREGKDVKALVDFARDKMKYIDIWAINMMRNQPRGGHIFNIDGAGSDGRPTPRFAAYGATKRSVVHLTKSLQAELQMNEVNNVMVHNLSPGMVTTDLLMSGATTKQVADYLVPNIRAIPTNQSMKPTYIRFLTGLKAYSRIFSRIAFGARRNKIMSNSQPAQEDDCMSSILVSRLIRAMQPTRSYLRWSDDLHKMFVEAVAYHGGPYEAKPTAVKETMQAMGVTGLTTHNIKSHLQKYRESFSSGVGSLHDHDLLRTTSPSKEALDLASEMVRDNDAAMAEIEMLNDLLLDHDIEMMERELMSEIKLIEHTFEISESALDEYMDDLANYAFDLTGPANSSSP
uniref:HTH myb-type domain-containing protein n=1 Tax=Oryza barthii TaxID=65489 RepID=A0A0D3FLY5_9ORYZ